MDSPTDETPADLDCAVGLGGATPSPAAHRREAPNDRRKQELFCAFVFARTQQLLRVAGVGGRRTGHPGSAIAIAWVASLVGGAVAGIYVLIFQPNAFSLNDMLWTLAAILFFSLARPLLYLGMERGPMAIFAPVIGVVGLVVPAVVGPLTGQALNGLELLGVLLAVPAVVLVVAEGKFPSIDSVRHSPALGLGGDHGCSYRRHEPVFRSDRSGRRRHAGFHSSSRRSAPDPACRQDVQAHGSSASRCPPFRPSGRIH